MTKKIYGKDVQIQAKKYLGTPYLHQGRLINVGIDCCGLIIGVGKDLNLIGDYDISGYTQYADGVSLLREFDEQCVAIKPPDNPQIGDILIFKIRNFPQHCGFLAEKQGVFTLIHSYRNVKKVVEHIYDKKWENLCVAIYRFKGVIQEK